MCRLCRAVAASCFALLSLSTGDAWFSDLYELPGFALACSTCCYTVSRRCQGAHLAFKVWASPGGGARHCTALAIAARGWARALAGSCANGYEPRTPARLRPGAADRPSCLGAAWHRLRARARTSRTAAASRHVRRSAARAASRRFSGCLAEGGLQQACHI